MNINVVEVRSDKCTLMGLLEKAGFTEFPNIRFPLFPTVKLTPDSIFYMEENQLVEFQIDEELYLFKGKPKRKRSKKIKI